MKLWNGHFVNVGHVTLALLGLLIILSGVLVSYLRAPITIIDAELLIMSKATYSHDRVHHLTQRDIVNCIETLGARVKARNLESLSGRSSPEVLETIVKAPLHFAFMGDSRVRQHFFRLTQYLPSNDFELRSQQLDLHTDRNTSSNMLNLILSYWWMPNIIVDDNVTNTVQKWISTPTPWERPYFLLIGIALHDMLAENGANHELYERKLRKLRPLLEELNKTTRVIWLSVHPTYDSVSNLKQGWKSSEVYSEKIEKYNEIARKVFSGCDFIYWEAATSVAAEYNRACMIYTRQAGKAWRMWPYTPYLNCNDYVHAGNVATAEASQLLLTEICKQI